MFARGIKPRFRFRLYVYLASIVFLIGIDCNAQILFQQQSSEELLASRDSLRKISKDSLKTIFYESNDPLEKLVFVKYLYAKGTFPAGYINYDSAYKYISQIDLSRLKPKDYLNAIELEADINKGRWHLETAIDQYSWLTEQYPNDQLKVGLLLRKIAQSYYALKEMDKALSFYEFSSNILKSRLGNYRKEYVDGLLIQTRLNKLLCFDQEAIDGYKEIFRVNEHSNLIDSVSLYTFYVEVAEHYLELDRPDSALHYFSQSKELYDIILDQNKWLIFKAPRILNNNRSIESILSFGLNSVEDKNRAIQATSSANKRARTFLIIALSLLVILAISYLLFLQKMQRKKVENLELIILGEEKERKRIAGDLHDSLGVLLTSIKLRLTIIECESAQRDLLWVQGQVDEACTELRRISHAMAPVSLTKLGLHEAVLDLLDNVIMSTQICVDERFEYQGDLDKEEETLIYRIIQELINNTLKYADARNIYIQMIKKKGEYLINYFDNGRGFEKSEIKNGLGFKSISARIAMLKGKLSVESSTGQGADFKIVLPHSRV